MGRAKVIYLDEYKKAKQYENLLEMIEGHLAEARLLETCSSVSCGNLKMGNKQSQLCKAGEGGEKPE